MLVKQEYEMAGATGAFAAERRNTTPIWILRVLLALAFGAAGLLKLAGTARMVDEFQKIGFGDWFLYLTGALEIFGVVLVLIPSMTFWGALILCGICAGAFAAQIGPLHGDVIHVFFLGALVVLTAWLTRPRYR
jgi:uncharacterized membrane protein YphA (DoxX/SURF4 family)